MKSTKDNKKVLKMTKKNTRRPFVDETQKDSAQKVKNYLENIIALIPEHVYWKDKNGIYLGCNDQQAKALGLSSRKEIIGKTDFDLSWKDQAKEIIANDQEVMKTGIPKIAEEFGKLADGSWIVAITHKVPLKNENNENIGILGISINITERKKMEEELKKAKEQAEIANNVKTEFLENMRHDIRTPFSGVLGIASYLEEIEDDPQKKELLGDVMQSSKALLDYCNNILDFSNIESGLPITNKKFSIKNLIDNLIKMETSAAKNKQLTLTSKIALGVPDMIIGDEFRVYRILINLVSNAVKFTSKGLVTVMINIAEKKKRTIILQIIVEDTGIGIPRDKQGFIYEKFSRLHPSSQGRYLGSGLGLRIVKEFIDDLEGEIEVQSELGKGTTFVCTIPFKLPLIRTLKKKDSLLCLEF